MTPVAKGGRPPGSRTFDPVVALSFGAAMRAARLARGICQERLAVASSIEASYLGRVERGESVPTLGTIFKIARGLKCRASELVDEAERLAHDRPLLAVFTHKPARAVAKLP